MNQMEGRTRELSSAKSRVTEVARVFRSRQKLRRPAHLVERRNGIQRIKPLSETVYPP